MSYKGNKPPHWGLSFQWATVSKLTQSLGLRAAAGGGVGPGRVLPENHRVQGGPGEGRFRTTWKADAALLPYLQVWGVFLNRRELCSAPQATTPPPRHCHFFLA